MVHIAAGYVSAASVVYAVYATVAQADTAAHADAAAAYVVTCSCMYFVCDTCVRYAAAYVSMVYVCLYGVSLRGIFIYIC